MSRNNNNNNVHESHRIENIKDSLRGLVDRGQERASAIKHKAVDIQHRAKERGGVALDRTTVFIKDNPIKSVAMAFGVGYLLMRLVRR
jgi:ElaB/YqjD/DUF883 family membrane-anchored ribosome-binding protein